MDLIKKTIDVCNKTGWFSCHLGEDNSVSMMIIKPVFYRKELEESIKKLIPFMNGEGMKLFIEYYDEVERNE